MKHLVTVVRIVVTAAALATALSACTPARDAQAPTAAPTTIVSATAAQTTALPPTLVPPTAVLPTAALPTVVPPTAALPTVAPPTAVPPTLVPPTLVPPTAVLPTTVPPTAVPPVEADRPGPGWIFALESDANQDGVNDKVYYLPAQLPPDPAEVGFADLQLAAVAVAASDIALVQRSEAGLNALLRIDIHGGQADQWLFDFTSIREPSGYLLALDPAHGPLFNLLPYGVGGVAYEQIGIHWEPGVNGFRVIGERQ